MPSWRSSAPALKKLPPALTRPREVAHSIRTRPWRGKLFSAHESWDRNDASTRRKVRTLADQVIDVRDGDEVGYGIIEYGVGKGFGQYESVQAHPPI